MFGLVISDSNHSNPNSIVVNICVCGSAYSSRNNLNNLWDVICKALAVEQVAT